MRKYNRYLVNPTDSFDPANYVSMAIEITKINLETSALPPDGKVDILLSFLTHHSIQVTMAKTNPLLVKMIESGSLFTGDIEALLESAKSHTVFSSELEKYLRESFAQPAN
jgi:hypothetical protein